MEKVVLAAVGLLSGFASVSHPAWGRDSALAAIQSAKPSACPPDRLQPGAQTQGFGPQRDVEITELETVPMAGEPARRVRLLRVTVGPGGVIGWHEHSGAQGIALLISGTVAELRNDCRDELNHRAGAIIKEYSDTAHGFRNTGGSPAVFLVMHGEPGSN